MIRIGSWLLELKFGAISDEVPDDASELED
jgi:hypothetical protein